MLITIHSQLNHHMPERLRPISDRVLVRAQPLEEKSKGGIIIPDIAKGLPTIGTIVDCGPGKPEHPIALSTGDKVLYGLGAGYAIEVNEEELILLRASDILGVIEED